MAIMARGVSAIDLFCGVGGLSYGLQEAGITVAAGLDIDPRCRYPYEINVDAPFLEQDVRTITARHLDQLWEPGMTRLLAGCAPCQPFSPYRRGRDTSHEPQWSLLGEFARLVEESRPELVTMENVPRIASSAIFVEFINRLKASDYQVDYKACYGPEFGLPQHRRRLVLVASIIGDVALPAGSYEKKNFRTVRDAISNLPPLSNGAVDPEDSLHKSRSLSEINLKRIQASRPGGSWADWPIELRAPCHQKSSGRTFKNVYSRMQWDEPSPTITTMAYNFGTGRFGHPEQDRAITLREAAILQGFPRTYQFVKPGAQVEFAPIGRLIGNAVPPTLAKAVGEAIMAHPSVTKGRSNHA